MKKFLVYIVFEKKLNSSVVKDHFEEVTLSVEATNEDEAKLKANDFIKKYTTHKYKGGSGNLVEKIFTNHIRIDEVLGFDKENGVEEINSTSFYDLESYLKYKNVKI
ncbi:MULTISPECIES: hypothetical protein [Tenacibaculum]|uniref:hypothetical protein n=1 Tax=Tenacibaculum TaxID=104267 RepID=UPI00187B85D1|nr:MULTISPECIES: hypothetical protein [Tenacibaculum]MCD8436044.1 hypothetical protein [Tenacibaculum dicentrarchi]MBE7635193.1 hypothetical protein [Tenacibaculum finnmarkense genomovar ulcerans]MCD8423654.1 hypothetical protein [Tenacibaculum finnmarkense genomovar ulcerans]MCD8431147.1 hypothetical protein [Tenacibaculum finnmarkense genomovar ulcerans]MCD8433639.1 hypothetical protein [Tenacibaculum finnmarkense genomovar ulcerans]